MKCSQHLGQPLLLVLVLSIALQVLITTAEDDVTKEDPSRIAGGANEVDFNRHKFIVSIQSMAHLCIGSFVHTNFILTAASCVANISPKLLRIRYGSPYNNEGGWFLNVNKTILHPEFDPITMVNDIALLRTETVPINNYDLLVSLATPLDNVTTSSYCNVTGFGFKDELTGKLSHHLQMVKLRGVEHATCKQHYAAVGLNITDGAFCLSSWGGGRGKSICQGDIGAIAFTESYRPNRARIAIGLASYSIGCGHRPSEHPNVFTRIFPYRMWMQSYINPQNL